VQDENGNSVEDAPLLSTLFQGRELDPETGLYYYRARYYSPRLGRFISHDPMDYSDGVNMYQFVRGNPVRYTDPFGFAVDPVSIAVEASVVVGLAVLYKAFVEPALKKAYDKVVDALSGSPGEMQTVSTEKPNVEPEIYPDGFELDRNDAIEEPGLDPSLKGTELPDPVHEVDPNGHIIEDPIDPDASKPTILSSEDKPKGAKDSSPELTDRDSDEWIYGPKDDPKIRPDGSTGPNTWTTPDDYNSQQDAQDKLDTFKPAEGRRKAKIPKGTKVRRGKTPGGEGPYDGSGGANETLIEEGLPPGSTGEWERIANRS
jgi:RHS repeat-associated protein